MTEGMLREDFIQRLQDNVKASKAVLAAHFGEDCAEIGPLINDAVASARACVETAENRAEKEGFIPTNPFVSGDVPSGYDTVWGYFSEKFPNSFSLFPDPLSGLFGDNIWCHFQANKRRIHVVSVSAPAAFATMGVSQVFAYPIELLKERFDD